MLSALCRSCGLCCGGSLFTFLPLTESEATHLAPWRVQVEKRRDGRWALLLPCAALEGTCCSAYERRPQRCRDYVCHLGRELERKERSFEAAMAIVEEAKARLSTLERTLGPATPGDHRGVLSRAWQVEATVPGDTHFAHVRDLAKDVESLLEHYFVGPNR